MGKKKKRLGKATVLFWSGALFIAVGYVPTLLLKNPVAAMAAAAVAVVPFGSRAKSYLRAAGRGLVLGAIAGLAIISALLETPGFRPDVVRRQGWVYATATVGMCIVVCVLFAHLAKHRRQRIEQEWKH